MPVLMSSICCASGWILSSLMHPRLRSSGALNSPCIFRLCGKFPSIRGPNADPKEQSTFKKMDPPIYRKVLGHYFTYFWGPVGQTLWPFLHRTSMKTVSAWLRCPSFHAGAFPFWGVFPCSSLLPELRPILVVLSPKGMDLCKKDLSRTHGVILVLNPMSSLSRALSIILTVVAHMDLPEAGVLYAGTSRTS